MNNRVTTLYNEIKCYTGLLGRGYHYRNIVFVMALARRKHVTSTANFFIRFPMVREKMHDCVWESRCRLFDDSEGTSNFYTNYFPMASPEHLWGTINMFITSSNAYAQNNLTT